MTRDELKALISQTIEEYNEILTDKKLNYQDDKALIFGGGGPLDSLELVALIVEIEEAIERETGKVIILADEKAVSRRLSPFARIDLLVDYTFEVLNNN